MKMESPPGSDDMRKLPPDFNPGPCDVICARGKIAWRHNVRFRKMVKEQVAAYSEAKTKVEKGTVVTSIVDAFRNDNPNGGGFVKFIRCAWFEVGERQARSVSV